MIRAAESTRVSCGEPYERRLSSRDVNAFTRTKRFCFVRGFQSALPRSLSIVTHVFVFYRSMTRQNGTNSLSMMCLCAPIFPFATMLPRASTQMRSAMREVMSETS